MAHVPSSCDPYTYQHNSTCTLTSSFQTVFILNMHVVSSITSIIVSFTDCLQMFIVETKSIINKCSDYQIHF